MFILPHLKALTTGNLGTAIFKSAGLDLKFADNKSLVDSISGNNLITFTRASGGTYVGSDGVLQTAATNEPRFDHNPTTGGSLGLLVEEQRTNLLSASEEMVTAPWGLAAATGVANNGIAPDGTTTADKIISTGGGCFRAGADVANATAYTYSVFLKYVTGTGVITQVGFERFGSTPLLGNISVNLLTGTITNNGAPVTSSSITPYSNNWYRVSITATSTDVTTTVINYTSASGSEFLIWGAMLEAGAFPTSYIPTTTAAATRAADVAKITGTNFSSWYRQDEGTWFAQHDVRNNILSANNNTFSERQPQMGLGTNLAHDFYSITGGAIQANSVGGIHVIGTPDKVAYALKVNNFIGALNGSLFGSVTSGLFGSLITQLNIGSVHTGASAANGTIRRLTYFPQRLPDSTLQAITQP